MKREDLWAIYDRLYQYEGKTEHPYKRHEGRRLVLGKYGMATERNRKFLWRIRKCVRCARRKLNS